MSDPRGTKNQSALETLDGRRGDRGQAAVRQRQFDEQIKRLDRIEAQLSGAAPLSGDIQIEGGIIATGLGGLGSLGGSNPFRTPEWRRVEAEIEGRIATAQGLATQANSQISSLEAQIQQARTDLRAEFDAADALIQSDITNLTSTVGQNTSDISQEATTRANADAALTTTVNQLTATVGDNTAAISAEAIARAGADTALAGDISTVSTAAGVAQSTAESAQLTASNAEQAISSITQTVEASFADWSALVSAAQTATATAEEATSALVFRTVAGSAGASFGLYAWDDVNAAAGSAIKLKADDILLEGSVSAKSLTVTDFTNLIVNNALIDAEAWQLDAGIAPVDAPSNMTPARAFEITSVTGSNAFAIYEAPVIPNSEYMMTALCRGSGAEPRQFSVRLGVFFKSRSGVNLASTFQTVATLVDTTENLVSLNVTAPDGAVSAEFYFGREMAAGEANPGHIASPSVVRRYGGELIVDGSITADKLAANEIITSNAQIGSAVIEEANIADAAITDAKISGEIKSENFVTGKNGDGWRISKNGDAEFGTLALREDSVTVSRSATSTGTGEINGSDGWVDVLTITLLPSGDLDLIVWSAGMAEARGRESSTGNDYEQQGHIRLLWRGAIVSNSERLIVASPSDVNVRSNFSTSVIVPNSGSSAGTLKVQLSATYAGYGTFVKLEEPVLICSEFKR